jgi:UDP-N-acetyl-D-galactosamine dehydrogenase
LADSEEVQHEYGLGTIKSPSKKYHAVVMAVAHEEFKQLDWNAICYENTVVYDVKGVLDRQRVTARL